LEMIFLKPDLMITFATPDKNCRFMKKDAVTFLRHFVAEHQDYSFIVFDKESMQYRIVFINDEPASFEKFFALTENALKTNEKVEMKVSIQGSSSGTSLSNAITNE